MSNVHAVGSPGVKLMVEVRVVLLVLLVEVREDEDIEVMDEDLDDVVSEPGDDEEVLVDDEPEMLDVGPVPAGIRTAYAYAELAGTRFPRPALR